MRSLLVRTLLLSTLTACSSGSRPIAPMAPDVLTLPVSLVERLYLSPLGVNNALVRVETEDYLVNHDPLAFQVHVSDATDAEPLKEVLSVGIVIVQDRVQFIGASGELLSREQGNALDEPALRSRTRNTLQSISDVTGWVEPSVARPGKKPGSEEIVFRDPHASPYILGDRRVVVLDSRSGLPIVVGSPSLPDPRTR